MQCRNILRENTKYKVLVEVNGEMIPPERSCAVDEGRCLFTVSTADVRAKIGSVFALLIKTIHKSAPQLGAVYIQRLLRHC